MKNKVHLVTFLLIVSALLIVGGVFLLQGDDYSRLEEARSTQRYRDMNSIVNAVYQYALNNDGEIPVDITEIEQEICASVLGCDGMINLSEDLEGTQYIIKIPVDSEQKDDNGSGYSIKKEVNGNITVGSLNVDISVSR